MSIFAKRVTTLAIVLAGLLLAMVPIFFAAPSDGTVRTFVIIGGIVAFGGLVWSWIVLRCPHCGALLPLRGWADSYCPNCGGKLQDK
ncbi:MAG: hypothetical protein PHE47_09340 [Oscillospiraceae bacterium]|nr:hypothetical protein [Oscillospiraceae bacterium]